MTENKLLFIGLNSTHKCNFDWLVKERVTCSNLASLPAKTKDQLIMGTYKQSSLKDHNISDLRLKNWSYEY